VETNTDYAQVTLDNGEKIRGKLVLGADSRMSFMRKALGISADMHDFGRSVLLFRCKHTASNLQTAHEGFYYSKTLAVLPLGEYQSSMVVTIKNSKLNELLSLSKEELAKEMMSWLNSRLGEMTVSSEIFQYPLLAVHADKFYSTRSALIGDSAVGMHPVTAHGYNLGMESVEILSKLIGQAVSKGQDIGSPQLLARYNRKHNLKTRPLYHGTNAIVKLYTDERKPAKFVRHLGLRVSDHLMPVKKIITNQLTG
ncbi:MAG: FAD-dependent monooxygenase, partial [Moraxellaceae bacterium]|nr:FAD-dependent monooxygenase [Moraxellaceae bacterium]